MPVYSCNVSALSNFDYYYLNAHEILGLRLRQYKIISPRLGGVYFFGNLQESIIQRLIKSWEQYATVRFQKETKGLEITESQ